MKRTKIFLQPEKLSTAEIRLEQKQNVSNPLQILAIAAEQPTNFIGNNQRNLTLQPMASDIDDKGVQENIRKSSNKKRTSQFPFFQPPKRQKKINTQKKIDIQTFTSYISNNGEKHLILNFNSLNKASSVIKIINGGSSKAIALKVLNYIVVYKSLFDEILNHAFSSENPWWVKINELFNELQQVMPDNEYIPFKQHAADHIKEIAKIKIKVMETDMDYAVETLFKKTYEHPSYTLSVVNDALGILQQSPWFVGTSYVFENKTTPDINLYTPFVVRISNRDNFRRCKEYLAYHTNKIIGLGEFGLIVVYNYQELPAELADLKSYLKTISPNLMLNILESDYKDDFLSGLNLAIRDLNRTNSRVDADVKTAFIAAYQQYQKPVQKRNENGTMPQRSFNVTFHDQTRTVPTHPPESISKKHYLKFFHITLDTYNQHSQSKLETEKDSSVLPEVGPTK